MITENDIRPIPKYIVEKIRKKDKISYPVPSGCLRYYAYLAKWNKELVKVTVAVRHKNNKWYYKQCAVHGIDTEKCLVKDMVFSYIGGYRVGWFEEGLTKYKNWYECPDWGCSDDKYFDPYAVVVNKEFALKIPEFKYSSIEIYNGIDVIQYLRRYRKYPQIEYLTKLGLEKLTDSKMILDLSSNDKKFCKWLIQNRTQIISKDYDIKVIIRAYKKDKSLDKLQALENCKKSLQGLSYGKEIREIFKGRLEHFFGYITEQNTNIYSYKDYYDACIYLELDMTRDKNLLPKNFQRWHDIRIDEQKSAKALKDKQERVEMYKQFVVIAEKYLPLADCKKGNYAVFIAGSPADLIKEGECLHHCVGRMNYDQKFIREESLIFFIRDKKTPNIPLVTMEYSLASKKILQCYGDHDSRPSDDVLKFANKIWLPYARKQTKILQQVA